MCRKSVRCTELGDDLRSWSRISPLPPPAWFNDELDLFQIAVRHAAHGANEEALSTLKKIRSDDLRYWFDEHGQMSGRHRFRQHGKSIQISVQISLDTIRSPKFFEKRTFARDFYTCRYCCLRLVAKAVLTEFEKIVGSSEFMTQGNNAQQHGIVHGFKIVADHVMPFKQGGRTDLNNLVTACPACNYGKDGWSVQQLGIDDPRDRPPSSSSWDGLTSFLPALRSRAADRKAP